MLRTTFSALLSKYNVRKIQCYEYDLKYKHLVVPIKNGDIEICDNKEAVISTNPTDGDIFISTNYNTIFLAYSRKILYEHQKKNKYKWLYPPDEARGFLSYNLLKEKETVLILSNGETFEVIVFQY